MRQLVTNGPQGHGHPSSPILTPSQPQFPWGLQRPRSLWVQVRVPRNWPIPPAEFGDGASGNKGLDARGCRLSLRRHRILGPASGHPQGLSSNRRPPGQPGTDGRAAGAGLRSSTGHTQFSQKETAPWGSSWVHSCLDRCWAWEPAGEATFRSGCGRTCALLPENSLKVVLSGALCRTWLQVWGVGAEAGDSTWLTNGPAGGSSLTATPGSP